MRKTKLTSALTTAFLLALFVFTNAQPVSSRPVDSSAVQNAPYPYVPDVILHGRSTGPDGRIERPSCRERDARDRRREPDVGAQVGYSAWII